ncbi:hypothetical protein GGR53DRAFT_71235 [Hypoxylon sp. FL1150]|nr:hypothetical protein GGR53DRAFT_71235 [Hypoxylon sp. FL1150]
MIFQRDGISASARAEAPVSSAEVIGVVALFMALCTGFTFARMCTRYFVHQKFWWDDWAMLVAWIGVVFFCIWQLVMVRYGAGVNVWEVPKGDLVTFYKLFLEVQMIARIAIFFARLAILLLYIRIFFPAGISRSTFWWIIQAVIWLNLLYTISFILATTLQCVPRQLPWGNSCVNQWLILVVSSLINVITDIAVMVIPIASIVKLHMAKRKKWTIWALFAFGALAPLLSITRLVYQVIAGRGENTTVIYAVIPILASGEQAVAMVAGSAPVVNASVVKLLWRRRTSSSQTRTTPQRFWPGRDTQDRPMRKDSRRVPDPFPIPADTWTDSTEILRSGVDARHGDGDEGQSWEMTPKAIDVLSRTRFQGVPYI